MMPSARRKRGQFWPVRERGGEAAREGLGRLDGPEEATKTMHGTRKEWAPKAEQKRPNYRVGDSRRVADPIANDEGGRRKRYNGRKGKEIETEKERCYLLHILRLSLYYRNIGMIIYINEKLTVTLA